MVLEGPGKEARILASKATGKARFESERLYGLPEHEFVGDYIRADPPRGRKGLLSQAMEALQSGEKLVVLTGQGGIGKTVLAAEAARRLAWRYPGGVFWRSAAEMERLGLEDMLNAFDNVIGPQLRALPLDQKRDTVLSYLREYDTASLLVVDNAESIKDEKLWRFLEGIPQPSAALVTTRESLPREGKEIRILEMEQEEATRLLWQEARRRSPLWGAHLSNEDKEGLNEIAQVMKGHPLAIKLTAALLARRSISSIRDELRRNPPQEVWERFYVSFKSLTEGQKDLFCRLAVFTSSMTEEAVGEICMEKKDSNWQSDLGELERRSFLNRIEILAQDQDGNEVTLYRYKLHPLMRQYATAKADSTLLDRLRPRFAEHFLEYAQSPKMKFNMLEWEMENILAGLEWAYTRKRWELVREYAWAVDTYLATRGYWKDRKELLDQAIKATQELGDEAGEANALYLMGNLAYATGDLDKAWSQYQKSLKISQNSQKLSYKIVEAKTLHQMGMLTNATGDLAEAKNYYKKSLKIKQKIRDKMGVAKTLHQMGIMAYDRGDLDKACRRYRWSLKIEKELKDKSGEAKTTHQMAILAYDTGNLEKARTLYEKSLRIKQDLQDKRGEAITLHHMGNLANATGNLCEAKELYRQSLKIKQELGDKRGIAITLHQMGNLAYATGNMDEAGRQFQESLKIRTELGDKNGIAKTLHKMANMAYDTGNFKDAQKLYQESLRIKQELGDKNGIAKTLHKMGNMEYDTGNLDKARELYDKSLEIKQQDLKDKRGESITRHQMGNMAYDAGNLIEAEKQYIECLRIEQEQLKDKRGEAKTLHQLGNIAYAKGNIEEAQKQYQDSLKFEQELEDKRGIAQTQHNLGIISFVKGELEEANKQYLESFRIKQRLGDKRGVAITLHQMGNIAYAANDLKEARDLYQESLKIDRELGDKQGMAMTLAQSSFLEEKADNLDKAREQIELARKIFLELNMPIASEIPKFYERLEKKGR